MDSFLIRFTIWCHYQEVVKVGRGVVGGNRDPSLERCLLSLSLPCPTPTPNFLDTVKYACTFWYIHPQPCFSLTSGPRKWIQLPWSESPETVRSTKSFHLSGAWFRDSATAVMSLTQTWKSRITGGPWVSEYSTGLWGRGVALNSVFMLETETWLHQT